MQNVFGHALVVLVACSLGASSQSIPLSKYPHVVRLPLPADAKPPKTARPPLDTLPLLVQAADTSVWLATPLGILRYAEGKYRYYSGKRYLPDNPITALSLDPSRTGVYAFTADGSGVHLKTENLTLGEKATRFEDRVAKRHNRHGMVADSHLTVPGDLTSNQLFSNDNDGLWTAMYGAAECYRYAVTKSPEALALAKRSVEALLYLEEVTGRPGFPARSYIKKGEPKPKDGFWYKTANGDIEWKADTSSDEIVGHFYLFSIAYDLLPDPALKKRIAATAKRIMDHILDNGYYLIDVTGKPTRWGKWSPAYFAGEGKSDAPLNAVELLAFLRATKHFTGDTKYDEEYRKAAYDLGYAAMAAKYLEWQEELNYSDEELALLSYQILFRYEKDPKLLPVYREGLNQWWKNIQRENNPLWMLIYKYCNPAVNLDFRPAVQTLADIPMDLIFWPVKNSHRADIVWSDVKDRFGKREALTLLPAFERPVMKWNGNPFVVDSDRQGNAEDDGGFYLLPYWMGRYMKAWHEPQATAAVR
ncbi:hypothetical protein F183_A32950 [Bryobacterales bacterium F-183]|nr:hypothetical protein F183_A32950 [Bryobacterales bacterium F-183]